MRMYNTFDQTKYGVWHHDEAGLPCFDADLEHHPLNFSPFKHLMSTGRLLCHADQFGNMELFTNEGGYLSLTPAKFRARSGLYPMIQAQGETFSLLYSELTGNKRLRYGIGYAVYAGEIHHQNANLSVRQEYLMAPDTTACLVGHFTVRNIGDEPLDAQFIVRSDVFPEKLFAWQGFEGMQQREAGRGYARFPQLTPDLGDFFLAADEGWQGRASDIALELTQNFRLKPGEERTVQAAVGYGQEFDADEIRQYAVVHSLRDVQTQWQQKLENVNMRTPEPWMRDECLWTAGQLLAFTGYDSSVQEHFINLGGYCWEMFAPREDAENLLAVTDWEPNLARSMARWLLKLQLANGDIPKDHNFRKDKRYCPEFESDNEIWAILGCCHYLVERADWPLLDVTLPYWDTGEGSVYEHLQQAYHWIVTGIGFGAHGLILMKDGDWNDYLSRMGAQGNGESVMNSGMACRAFDLLATVANQYGDSRFSAEVARTAATLRQAVANAFDQHWFVRGYTDAGQPVGGYVENRVFLNAQTWAALGRCGTPEQRRTALLNALEQCGTSIGLTLMSRPFPSPPPSDISWAPIPAGEGENAAIWPQTVHWFIWALAEHGLIEQALDAWKAASLRNHARLFPDVPYGILNGPDCYSSKHAGQREGWTQYLVWDRTHSAPMNPAVAWQAFSMKKILDV